MLFFVHVGGFFFGLPPPRTKISAGAHEYMVLLRTIVKDMGDASPKILKIVCLMYIFDKVPAFAKCSGGMHSRETLFKWCNLVRFRI